MDNLVSCGVRVRHASNTCVPHVLTCLLKFNLKRVSHTSDTHKTHVFDVSGYICIMLQDIERFLDIVL